jgi:hypothetical protein
MAHSGNRPPARQPSSPATSPKEIPNSPSEAESLEPAVEIIRPFLRDPEMAPQAVAKMVTAVRMFRGPLPPPEVFKGYDDVLPGSAREILDMASREQRHRHKMQWAEMAYPYLGWFAGFACFLACIAGSVYLAINNSQIVSGLLLGVPCLGVIGWFIRARITGSESGSPRARDVLKTPAKRPPKRRP